MAAKSLALNFGAYLGKLTDTKADGNEALRELIALRAQAESNREKKL